MTSRSRACFLSFCALSAFGLGGLPSCADQCEVTKTGNPSNACPGSPVSSSIADLARQCGIDVECEGVGIARGNTAISGVQSIDSYFASVVRFQIEADERSTELNSELSAIRAAFGIDASADLEVALRERIADNVEGELVVRAGEPSCAVAADAVLGAGMRCADEAVDPSVAVRCRGRCELPVSGELACDADAELACTFLAVATPCQGECKGRCASDGSAARECAGICRGSCDGSCSVYSDPTATLCAGRCDGMCTGSCELELPEGAACDGACSGECTLANPDEGCAGASSASCRAAPDAAVACDGRCIGEIELPQAKAECTAVVEAEAKFSLQCAPPHVAVDYRRRSDIDPETSVRFELGIRTLQERLPALLVTLERARQTASVGADLVAGASSLVKAAAGSAEDSSNLRIRFGALCAVAEAGRIPRAVAPASERLRRAVTDSLALTSALGVP
ncbi:MAG TPA: hypothetical protein VK509_23230 [Polyangiales bacterium]|nr:hypothetical protein [Polyangiales bacterium]